MREITAMDHQEEDATVTLPATAAEPMTSIQGVSPGYLVELAKSGRAECKKCGEKIENKTIRVGVILEGDWGLFTRWQHLACTIFHPSLASCNNIDGYQDLSSDHQKDVQTRYEMSKNEVDEDMKPLDPDALVRKVWDTAVEPCNDLLMPLLPYQKEGLGWMLHQELSDIHGGILADEMGMGM
jgi:DNA repair protein RAD16